jgi:hypothetical protein
MLADPDLFVVLAQQLTPNDIPIFGHNAHQSIDIFRMLADQVGQLCHLTLKMFHPPERIVLAIRDRLLSQLLFHKRRDQYIPLHIHPFARILSDTLNRMLKNPANLLKGYGSG